MNQRLPPSPPMPLSQRLLVIGMTVAAIGAGLYALTLRRAPADAPVPEAAPVTLVAGAPIAAEAEVFRTRPGMEAIQPDARRRATAHPRTLAMDRTLRSYPGAPPRVPHGLTSVEFRTNQCNTCHERGGYAARFESYAPVTPHPEWTACLQCHAATDAAVGMTFPQAGPNDSCRQCHVGTPQRFQETGIDWRPAAWLPVSGRRVGPAPVIPHDRQLRGNCLACHMGLGAVLELRTDHPERANCRQCHVDAGGDAADFTRPAAPATGGTAR